MAFCEHHLGKSDSFGIDRFLYVWIDTTDLPPHEVVTMPALSPTMVTQLILSFF